MALTPYLCSNWRDVAFAYPLYTSSYYRINNIIHPRGYRGCSAHTCYAFFAIIMIIIILDGLVVVVGSGRDIICNIIPRKIRRHHIMRVSFLLLLCELERNVQFDIVFYRGLVAKSMHVCKVYILYT